MKETWEIHRGSFAKRRICWPGVDEGSHEREGDIRSIGWAHEVSHSEWLSWPQSNLSSQSHLKH